MKKRDLLTELSRSQLLELVNELQSTLKKKNDQLYSLRTKMSAVKGRLRKMQDTVSYQRKRILELYQ